MMQGMDQCAEHVVHNELIKDDMQGGQQTVLLDHTQTTARLEVRSADKGSLHQQCISKNTGYCQTFYWCLAGKQCKLHKFTSQM